MKAKKMSEPISGTAASFAGWKLLGGLAGLGAIGAGLAAVVVMAMTKPERDDEWRIALITTVMGSFGGGAAFIKHFELEHWVDSIIGLMGMIGIVFVCGLPAWVLVRWGFNYAHKKKNSDLVEVVKELKELV